MKINENYLKLPGSYLFATMAAKQAAFRKENPGKELISLGIGDVTRPLAPAVLDRMRAAVEEMSGEQSFKGYSPDRGYDFLISLILEHDYKARGVSLDETEVFISDGAKCDTANIGDIFSVDNTVALCDPVYPVYVDTNAMAGRAGEYSKSGGWSKIVYMPCTEENNFTPPPPEERADIIYLCYPNNPTGAAITREGLRRWVDYALSNNSVILYDAAYEAYIRGDFPHSIYEIPGAKKCAIEFKSYSKTAGFTGVRCGYTVVPHELMSGDVSLNKLWQRRQSTKFNGASYVSQAAAAAIYSDEGRAQIRETIDYYMENASLILKALGGMGFTTFGGENAPYVWLKTPGRLSSWEFFDELLNKANVVGTPGSGFGPSGEGYFRLTAFGNREKTIKALNNISEVNWFARS